MTICSNRLLESKEARHIINVVMCSRCARKKYVFNLHIISPCVQCAFTVRSPCVNRSQCCALRSSPFGLTVHKAFSVRSYCVQEAISNRLAFVTIHFFIFIFYYCHLKLKLAIYRLYDYRCYSSNVVQRLFKLPNTVS